MRRSIISRSLLAVAVAVASATAGAGLAAPIAPKVLVITMFGAETAPWLEGRTLDTRVAVPGLSKEFPEVACDAAGLCVMTTSMGYANAATSVSAVILSGAFDLSKTYFLIAGIAGVDPSDATLGSALWARYVIDGGLRHEIDPRQVPADWPNGMLGLGAEAPGEKPTWGAGTEVYHLSDPLVDRALELTQGVELADSPEAAAYRATYDTEAARAAPVTRICDTASMDTYWHGSMIAEGMEQWVWAETDGAANYCTTQMEDNSTLTALRRGADAGLLDFERVAVLRTASNFDREAPGQTPVASLAAKSGGFGPATTNAYRVGSTYADAIIDNWPTWSEGVPAE
jgi:purine nucleoside permease